MIVLELPKTTEPINILGNIYEIDITDFGILTEIKELQSMQDGFKPPVAQLSQHIEQIQEIFKKVLGESLTFPKKSEQITYFSARALLVQLYNVLQQKQSEYLNLEYAIERDRTAQYQAIAEITRNLNNEVLNRPDEQRKAF